MNFVAIPDHFYSYSMGKYGADSRSTYSSVTQPEYGSLQIAKSSDFRRLGYIIGDGYSGKFEFTTADPRIYGLWFKASPLLPNQLISRKAR